jgi:type III secretion system YscD/HrpQ family protein
MAFDHSNEVASMELELRVLTGQQAGSRLALADGSYLLGSDDACDVILNGPAVSPEHARLTIQSGTARLDILPTALHASAAPLARETLLARGEIFAIGNAGICVDAVSAPWPDSAAPLAVTGAPSPDVQPTEPFADSESPSIALANRPQESTGDRVGSRPWKRVAASTLAVSMFGAAAIWAHGEIEKPAPTPAPSVTLKPPETAAERLGRELQVQFQNVKPSTARDGKVSLKGYVADEVQRQALIEQMKVNALQVEIAVHVDSDLLARARNVLATRPADPSVIAKAVSVAGGKLRLEGAAASQERVEALVDAVRMDVPGIREFDLSLATPGELRETLKERLAEAGLSPKLSVLAERNGVVLNGALNAEEMRKWIVLFSDFSENFGTVLPIRASITRQGSPLPFGIQSVSGGVNPFVMTTTGEKLIEGASLAGYKLTAIRDNELVFEGAERINIPR